MIRLNGLAAGLAPSGWQLKSSSALLEGARRGPSSDLKRQPVVGPAVASILVDVLAADHRK